MRAMSIFSIFFSLSFLIPEVAFAAIDDNAVSCVLCKIVNLVTGNIGRSLSIIIVISLGFMLFIGKVTWGLAIAIFIGMALIFGAENVVSLIGGFEDSGVCGGYNSTCDLKKKGQSGV